MAEYYESDTGVSQVSGVEGEVKSRPEDYKSSYEKCKRWKQEIEFAEGSPEYEEWEERCKMIRQRYKNEASIDDYMENNTHRYAILWSNIQTMRPALYSRTPIPYIRRRYKDNDPVARVSAEILERANKYTIDEDETFDQTMSDAVNDFLLFGKAWTWNRYEFEEENGQIVNQKVVTDHVSVEDIIHNPAQGPHGIRWIARKSYMRRDQLEDFFKDVDEEKIARIPLDHRMSGGSETRGGYEGEGDGKTDAFGRACIYEIWDKESEKVYWISKSFNELIDESEPPLKLKDFFPCPNPLIGTRSGSMNPTPDYIQYRDQAMELDELTTRIYYLTRALKNNFAYDAGCDELGRLLIEGNENQGFPSKNWPQHQKSGGFRGMMEFLPIENTAQVLQSCLQARSEVLNVIYSVTGIADIIRGASNPLETAKAQQIKGKFATLRLSERQESVQRFVRDNLRIRSEIISEMFEPQVLLQMVNFPTLSPMDQQIAGQAVALLRTEPIRCYKIEIETDSTVAVDEDVDRKERSSFTQSLGQFFNSGLPLMQAYPAFGPVMSNLLMFNIRGMKVGRTLEGEIESALSAFVQQAQNPPPAPPDPKMMAEQQKMQLKQQEFQLKVQESQAEMQLEMQKLQGERALKGQELQVAMQGVAQEYQAKLQKIETDYNIKLQKMQMDSETKIKQAVIEAMADQKVAMINSAETPGERIEALSRESKEPVNLTINMPSSESKIARIETLPDGSKQAFLETVGRENGGGM